VTAVEDVRIDYGDEGKDRPGNYSLACELLFCAIPHAMILPMIHDRKNGRRRSQLTDTIVDANMRRERGRNKDRPERIMNDVEVEDPSPVLEGRR